MIRFLIVLVVVSVAITILTPLTGVTLVGAHPEAYQIIYVVAGGIIAHTV